MKEEHGKENERLQEELESLYHMVARKDQADGGDAGGAEDLTLCYAALQVSPDASLAEIADSYEKLKEAWREDRFADVASWQEESRKKLGEIKAAYEKVLSFRPYESKAPPELSRSDKEVDAFLPTAAEDPPGDDGPPPSRIKVEFARFLIGGAVVAALLALAAVFIWPTLYHYEAIRMGDKIFPIRVSRMTSETTYFNGRAWVRPPIPVAADQKAGHPASFPAPPLVAKAPAPPPSVPQVIERPASPPPSAKEPDRGALPKPKEAAAESALDLHRSAPAAPSIREKALPAPKTMKKAAVRDGGFTIQVKAFRDEAKARAFMTELPLTESEKRIEKALLRDGTVWYRASVGRFQKKDQALKYLKKNKIFDAYPGSFVQPAGNAS